MKLLLIVVLCFSVSACADVYQWQDAKGSKHYSDRAHDNSTKIVVKQGYSFVRVVKVFDGDTVKLEDGRKVRLLGINAPEVQHKGQATEAGGESAKRWLTEKLINKKIRLVKDVEETDKYKRVLAHIFTENKDHINLQLIEMGLAVVNIYPPNLLYADQLAAAGARAEQAKRGIWQQHEYAAVPVEGLDDNGHSGWLRLVGKVSVIRSSRKYVYLEFSNQFQARVEKKWLMLFPDINIYRGKTLEVRGWLNKNRDGWSMLIRHPSALKIISG
jgi:endonuclease YncB( thermonuclease family)